MRSKEGASSDTLRWHLIKANFREDAADKLIKVFLESRDLVNAETEGYAPEAVQAHATADPVHQAMVDVAKGLFDAPGGGIAAKVVGGQRGELAMGVQERVLQSGMLSKVASYRVIVSGPVGEAEIDRLIRKLEMDKEILADPDPTTSIDGNVDPLS
ncbi:hypothetical protein DAH55_05790 [Sphingomonas koreensis]|nr:hypothetical protein DAH56_06370 [Sphingomonas koreensis]RSU70581.1 hypothetical protein DAH55_05790 [Sphingomonas koreensis]